MLMNGRMIEKNISRRKCGKSIIERSYDRLAVLCNRFRLCRLGFFLRLNRNFSCRFSPDGFFTDRLGSVYLCFGRLMLMNGRLVEKHISR